MRRRFKINIEKNLNTTLVILMESDDIEMYGISHIKIVLSAYECYFYTMENVWQPMDSRNIYY